MAKEQKPETGWSRAAQVGPTGTVNPNKLTPAGSYYDPVTKKGGQPAPARDIQRERAEELFNQWKSANPDLASDPQVLQVCVNQFQQVQTEFPGATPEQAAAEATRRIRSVPGFQKPADMEKWTADNEVARLQRERQSHGMRESEGQLRGVKND